MTSWDDNTTVMFHLENAADLKGYTPGAEDEDDTAEAAFKAAEVDQTPVVVTDTVS